MKLRAHDIVTTNKPDDLAPIIGARDSEEAECTALARLLAARAEPPAYGLSQRVNAPAGIGLFPTAGV